MFKETKVLSLFPTGVWAHTLEPAVYEPLNARLEPKIHALLAEVSETARQTRNDLHGLDEFRELCALMTRATQGVLEFLQFAHQGDRITGCWANVRKDGAPEHKAHTHPNNYLSGVYYVAVQEGADVITFYDPRPQVNIISPKRKKITEHNTREVHLTVKTGSLIVFPAWLYHSVEPNTSGRDRISVSFNAMFTDYVEDMAQPKWRPR